ncbi:MAG: hypothetical protein SFX72_10000 [Isosphaeraceae bacterium]|nr:hypothetical protein [Isosphaeraceae bacterium]
MSSPDVLYRLVIFEAPDDPHAARDLFCRVTGAHPTDAMQWLARAPGLWIKPLAEAQVRELLDGLFDLEVPAEAWRSDVVPDFGRIRTVHSVACLEDGFRADGLRGEPAHWIPWNKVELVSAGRIAAEDEYRHVAPPTWLGAVRASARFFLGRKPIPHRSSRAMRIPRDPVPQLILVRKDPFLALRMIGTQLNYAYLGKRIAESSMENFPLLVEDVATRATAAYLTEPTKRILDKANDTDEPLFPSDQALVDYTFHRLLWSWYRRDRDANAPTES